MLPADLDALDITTGDEVMTAETTSTEAKLDENVDHIIDRLVSMLL